MRLPRIHLATLRLGLGCLLALHGLVAAAQSPLQAGTVKRIEGRPMLASATGERPAEVGSIVFAGDRVLTGDASAVGMTLLDGTLLSVGPRSAVTVQAFRFDSTTHEGSLLVDIARGALRMVSGLIGKTNPRAVGVNTPTATIGIRGTDFVVDVGDDPPVR